MTDVKQYVKVSTTPLYEGTTGKKTFMQLLWGDSVLYDDSQAPAGERIIVKARGKTGYVDKNDLGDESLLEVYFIDVGQGDGILIKTPDGKHILIDGGYKRDMQQCGKNAADFVDWKFKEDYGMNSIELDAMMASHNDADHYGGLWDLINPAEQDELDILTANVNVQKFYHAGVAWLKKDGNRSLGPVVDHKLTLLVEDLADINNLLGSGRDGYTLQGEWADFMQCLADKQIPCERVSHKTGKLDQFETNDFSIKVLSPIETDHQGNPAYENLGAKSDYSINTNGHSITLRIDYQKVKILLTGDLNAESQKRILEYYENDNNSGVLSCDLVKACHHGSDDCSFEFLSRLSPCATVISSGDAEGHSHPRPSIVAASALTGFLQLKDDKIVTPLIYSTEISRSYKIGQPVKLKVSQGGQIFTNANKMEVTYNETNAGDLHPATKTRSFWDKKIVGGIIYGLVNIRTDGRKILCATMSEKDNGWDIKEFESRF